MTKIQELKDDIHDIREEYVKKLLTVLREDPDAAQHTLEYTETEEYLWKLLRKDGSILHGLIAGMEKHLEV